MTGSINPRLAPTAPASHRAPLQSLHSLQTAVMAMPTAIMKVSPAFIEALRKVGPKKRRAKVRYVVALAVFAVLSVLGSDAPTREIALMKGHDLAVRAEDHLPASVVAHLRAPAAASEAPASEAAAPAEASGPPAPASASEVIVASPTVFTITDDAAPVESESEPAPAKDKSAKKRKSNAANAKRVQRRTASAPRRHKSLVAAQVPSDERGF